MKEKQKNDRLYTWISLGLQLGTFFSLGLVATGLIMLAIPENRITDAAIPLSNLPKRLLCLDANVISSLGIVILLLTPILQVAIAAARFAYYKDRCYLSISVVLLLMLAISLFMSATID